MGRPTTKTDLLTAAATNYEKLNILISELTEQELSTPFDFSNDIKKKEAHWKRDKDLKDICNPNMFNFDSTAQIEDTKNLIYGQDRGIKALEFGVNIDVKGYNMYLEGPTGVGKTK